VWVESKLEEIVAKYSETGIDKDSVEKLRSELKELGMGHLVPEALIRVAERKE
jgi:hypothetical protein